jgi:hypothetical protein
MTALNQDEAVRCSTWARSTALDPIGTVGSYTGYVLVEVPLPWPRDVSEMASMGRLPIPAGHRLQAVVPTSMESEPAERQVIVHRFSGSGPFCGYVRSEARQGSSVSDAVTAAFEAPPAEGVDLLVCTHGRRDVCCGSKGTDLAMQLVALGPRDGVTPHRTSHTGGHRFAPTFVLLPQGTAWAFGSVDLVSQVLERSVPFASIAAHYRGCAGLSGPHVQAVERSVLSLVGWELLDRARHGFATGETTSDGGRVVRLEAGTDRWEAVVRPGRTLPVPDCMRPLSAAKKTETEIVVSDLRSL